jgi:very-short-patch-repair endonuclease
MSQLEDRFLQILQQEADLHGMVLEPPVREYRFSPTRRWRFDFAWPHQRVAVEIDGGTWSGGRHGRGGGSHGDREKFNAGQLLGWCVLSFDGQHLREDPRGVFLDVMEGLGAFVRVGGWENAKG